MDKKALYKISYGLYIVSSKKGDKFNGQIANTVFQTTAEPPMVAICINKKNLTHEFIQKSKVFTISILSKETPMKFIGLFGFRSGRDLDKFKDVNYKIGIIGIPIVLDNTIGYLECEVISSMDAKSHTLFLGKVLNAEIINGREPMTYAYYHEVKGGVSPKTAPTYIKRIKTENEKRNDISIKEKIGKKIKREGEMEKYECLVCGYIYDPEKGDPDSGIDPGTPFEKLSDDWVCPECGAGKDEFEKVE